MNHPSPLLDLLDKSTGDPRTRLELGPDIYETVKSNGLSSDSTVLTRLCDTMSQWLSGSNYKVALMSLDIIEMCLATSGDLLAPYLLDNITVLMERLGDTKDQVRQQTHNTIIKFMAVPHSSPQACMDRMDKGFQHKQWLVRVGCMRLLQAVIATYGSHSVNLSKFLPSICKNVCDAQAGVRDSAVDTLVEIYIVMGDSLMTLITHKRFIQEPKLSMIRSRFCATKNAGLVGEDGSPLKENTVPDCAASVMAFRTPTRPTQSPGTTRSTNNKPAMLNRRAHSTQEDDNHSVKSSTSTTRRSTSSTRRFNPPARSAAGAVTEQFFVDAFDECPKVSLYSSKELIVHTQEIKDILSDINNDWEKRVDALKKMRSLVIGGALDYDEFRGELRLLEVPFQLSAKDLRSQVVREACVTIAFLATRLGIQLEHFAEAVAHALINMIQNSAKIMASSAMVACKFIIQNVQSAKLIPVVTSYLNSKSREIRRACVAFVILMMEDWPVHALERNMPAIREAIRAGLCDADAEVRTIAKKGYQTLSTMYGEQAEQVYQSLDVSRQKQLASVSASSSSNSIGGRFRGSQENIHRAPLAMQRSGTGSNFGARSTSDIDPGAAKRAMQRAMVQRTAKAPLQPMNSLPRPPKRPSVIAQPKMTFTPPDRLGRATMSQPGSRSNSPTSRLPIGVRKLALGAGRRSSNTSREHSPNRSSGYGRRFSSDATSPPGAKGGRVLGARDMEKLFLDALTPRRRNTEDMDETGSVCSEKSYSRYEHSEIGDALRKANSHQWADRKEGLHQLQSLFRKQDPFTQSELKRVVDTFTRMFVDPHNKTFNLFLDVLVDFLASYRSHLCDWLYVVLTRLLGKLGTDMLASIQTKLHKTLDVVRESFPYESQFNTLVRYINDPAQTPSLKVKTAVLNYMSDLSHLMDARCLTSGADTKSAVLKINAWSLDPKSNDVRKAACNLLVALFSLNASEFTQMISSFTQQNQDHIYKLLQTNLNNAADNSYDKSYGHSRYGRSSMSPAPSRGARGVSGNLFDLDQVHDRLRETSAQIQNTFSTGLDRGSQDSGIVDAADGFPRGNELANGHANLMASLCNEEERQKDIIEELHTELSNHNTRFEQRYLAMRTLKQMTKDGSLTLWEDNFKTTLLLLLESLSDQFTDIRLHALVCIREICLVQSIRFRDYSDLTILKVLECHKDSRREVVKAAEECAMTLVTHLPPKTCLRLLNATIKEDASLSLLGAIKMVTKVLEQLGAEEMIEILPEAAPGIVKAAENSDSGVRKASVLALVAMHNSIGIDKLQSYLHGLSNSKMKLLNLYVARAQSSSQNDI